MSVRGSNVIYSGSDVRFYFPGGRYTLTVTGTGISISAVGSGSFSAIGASAPDDGSFTVDGGHAQSIDFAGSVTYGKGGGGGNGRGKNG
jgi:hypothetical protein